MAVPVRRWIPWSIALVCASLAAAEGPLPEGLAAIHISPADTRAQGYLELPSGLRVLLVSDPDAPMAAAAMTVGVGLQDDDPARAGLAHLLEHVLLAGSAQREDDQGIKPFVGTRGGRLNATTSDAATQYHFTVAPEHLEAALARFGRLFTAPRFELTTVARELNAVDAESRARLGDPKLRELAVHQQAANPEHPWSWSSGGSRATLGAPDESLREALQRFHERNYSADRMALTVLGREPLHRLQHWVQRHFAAVPRRPWQPAPAVPLFPEDRRPWLTHIAAEGGRRLTFWFPIEVDRRRYACKPHDYLFSLLSYEGPGSLQAVLAARGWIVDQAVARLRVTERAGLASVRFSLTAAGARHVPEIGEALFAYLDLIRRRGIRPDYFRERRRAAALRFHYAETPDGADYVRATSRRLLLYPWHDAARVPYAWDRYDPAVLRRALAAYRPERVFVSLSGAQVATDRTTPRLGVRYRSAPLRRDWLDRWRSPRQIRGLALQPPSPFDPGRPQRLTSDHGSTRSRVAHAEGLELWHLPHSRISTPQASLRLELASPAAHATTRGAAYLHLLADALERGLARERDLGEIYGYRVDVDATAVGLEIRTRGYRGAFLPFTDAVLERLARVSVSEQQFRLLAAHQRHRLASFVAGSRPLDVLANELWSLVLQPGYGYRSLLDATAALDHGEFERWRRAFLRSLTARGLVAGHLSRRDAGALVPAIAALLPDGHRRTAHPERTVVELPGPTPRGREVALAHPDAAVAMYLQGPDARVATHARMRLLGPLLDGFLEHALRERRQLGYLVGVEPATYAGMPGLLLTAQSPRVGASRLVAITHTELRRFARYLEGFSESSFRRLQTKVAQRLARPAVSLDQVGAAAWRSIWGATQDVETRLRDTVDQVTRADLRRFYRDLLNALEHRSLALVSPGRHPTGE